MKELLKQLMIDLGQQSGPVLSSLESGLLPVVLEAAFPHKSDHAHVFGDAKFVYHICYI